MSQRPLISPDGNYWWDGYAWQLIPRQAPPAPPAPPQQQQAQPPLQQPLRPSWLADGTDLPGMHAGAFAPPPPEAAADPPQLYAAPPNPYAAAPNPYAPPPTSSQPLWMAPAPTSSSSRTFIMAAAVTAIAVMLAGAGFWMWHQSNNPTPSASSTNPGGVPNPSTASSPSALAVASPTPSPVAASLTANESGQYCPVAHVGDSACWKGVLVNTGPPISNLEFVFYASNGFDGYTNWFTTHSNGTLSGFYTSPSCQVEEANARVVCGPVAAGQEVDVYLGGDVTTRGTFQYAVVFADLTGPSTHTDIYDGTSPSVAWVESIS